MNFLRLSLIVGLALTTTAQAEEMAVAIELSDSSNAPFRTNDPLGRGILDRKEKKLLRLYCQQRENEKCVQAQYGVSDFDRSQTDEFGNLNFADGIQPASPLIALMDAKYVNATLVNENQRGWKYPKLKFGITKHVWTTGYISKTTPDEHSTIAVGGFFLTVGTLPFGYYCGPTIIDGLYNAIKLPLIAAMVVPNEIIKTFKKNPNKIVQAMTETSKDWQFKPMKVSHQTFTKTLAALELFAKAENRNTK